MIKGMFFCTGRYIVKCCQKLIILQKMHILIIIVVNTIVLVITSSKLLGLSFGKTDARFVYKKLLNYINCIYRYANKYVLLEIPDIIKKIFKKIYMDTLYTQFSIRHLIRLEGMVYHIMWYGSSLVVQCFQFCITSNSKHFNASFVVR